MPVAVDDAPVRVSGPSKVLEVTLGVCICLTLILCAAAGLIAASVAFVRTEPLCGIALAGFVAL